MIKRAIAFSLITLWVTGSFSWAFAQSLSSPNWADWNTVTLPLFPKEYWMQYETPEEAGWSSDKLSSVQHWIDECQLLQADDHDPSC